MGLRICLVSGTYPPARCGVGDYAELLAHALAEKGAHVSVVTSGYLGIASSSANPEVHPVAAKWSVRNAWTILREILRAKPDIVHFQFPTTEYYAHRFFDLLVPLTRFWPGSRRVVVTFHEPVSVQRSSVPGVFRPLRHWLSIAWADALIVVAESYRNMLQGVYAPGHEKLCRAIPIASNIPASRAGVQQLEELRANAGFARTSVIMSYFGFIQPRKGFEQVLETLQILRERGVPAELMVIGELSQEAPYHAQLWEQVDREGLRNYVRVTGHLDRSSVADHLAMSDACILPFIDGVHPKRGSYLAAVRQGVLTVTTSAEKSGFSADENVYYARIGDTREMADAVQAYAGRKIEVPATSLWSRGWEEVAQEHLNLFDELLSGKSQKEGVIRRAAVRSTAAETERREGHPLVP